ncbi:MAG: RNA 2'-phosphotransferase [Planctomycetaceae bacterium]|nr:RNA 2'-phosphotransferase [Planctomycetaceae bacterium]
MTCYSQTDPTRTFYREGEDLPTAMNAIFAAHGWSPNYDPAWAITEAGSSVADAGGRSVTRFATEEEPLTLQPRQDLYDPRFYVCDTLIRFRKIESVHSTQQFRFSLMMFDPGNINHWRPAGQMEIQRLPFMPSEWVPISRALTKTLRWDGCKHGSRRRPVGCDTGGWFPVKELYQMSFADILLTPQILLNIIYHDNKGRFQVCFEADDDGRFSEYFAVRATQGHGIPWLDQRRLACPVDAADLAHLGCVTHITQFQNLIGIFRLGLLPGGNLHHSARAEINFGCHFYDDKRRDVTGRAGQFGYDVSIVFDKARLARACSLFLSNNGVLLTKD